MLDKEKLRKQTELEFKHYNFFCKLNKFNPSKFESLEKYFAVMKVLEV